MKKADLAVRGFAVNHGRIKVANFLPAATFKPQYWWTRYPLETTKMWNLIYLFTPASWMWTFLSIASIVLSLKISCMIGAHFGLNCITESITLFPFRYFLSSSLSIFFFDFYFENRQRLTLKSFFNLSMPQLKIATPHSPKKTLKVCI